LKTVLQRQLILLLFLFFNSVLCAQKTEKALVSKTWFCNGNFNSDSLVLSADNMDKPLCEARFTRTGRLVLKNLKKRTSDSVYTYLFKNSSLTLYANEKDSVKTLHYTVKKISGKKAYELRTKYSSRYVKRKGDDAIVMDRFTLTMGKRKRTVKTGEELAIFSQNRALRNDSINRAVWGVFVGYVTDTLLMESDQFVEHNFYKKYTDSLHYIAPLLLDTIIRVKVPIKFITGIYAQREPLSSVTTNASVFALVTGLVCVSASILAKGSTAGDIFGEVGVVSFLTIPVSFATGLIFSKQKFQMKSGAKKEKVWKIERHMPRTVITQRNKKNYKLKK